MQLNRFGRNKSSPQVKREAEFTGKRGSNIFGWVENPYTRFETLILSTHSRIYLARENTKRCREQVDAYIGHYLTQTVL